MKEWLVDRRAVTFLYLAAAIAAPASFWLFARTGYVRLDMFYMTHLLLPLSGISLLMAVTRRHFWSGLSLEVSAAVLWVAAVVAFSITDRLFERYGQAGTDMGAGLLALSATAMLLMALRLLVGGRNTGRFPAQIIYGIGVLLCAGLSLRNARVLYLNTRMLESPGIAGVVQEARLRFWWSIAVLASLIVGRLLRWKLRGAEPAGVA